METFDLTPDPKVLIALTHTPMQPLDALCELIDNSIDSFHVADLQGVPVKDPLIVIDLPRMSELNKNAGILRIRDNGIGLTRDMAEKAIRAGFSGNNPYDSLGLFGMGFNISTGKLGRVTRFLTSRYEEAMAIQVVINLEQITQSGSYQVPFELVSKPTGMNHGTIVEIGMWWPEGNPNSGFIRKLVQYGIPTVRNEVGRRYASILRGQKVRIIINGDYCSPFEHCRWSDLRSVERRGTGIVPAAFHFDELLGTQKRCGMCTALVPASESICPACASASMRTLEERVRGWVGVQRFDHETDFGIDLVRNGRAIRIGEKSAFFEYFDEFKRMVKDYPIDSPYGRIVGEVHLNHVPVDFLKQDFQRSSPEWQRAISFIRGDTPLQPGKVKVGEINESVVFKLYQGYRRVRTPGKTDMYMGYWDINEDKAKRISRDKERELFQKFKERVPGFYDDSEWWKLVEQADRRPVEELIECPDCGSQNLKEHDICDVCGSILIAKPCVNETCSKNIPQSASSCPHCGESQVPEIEESWTCKVCRRTNGPGVEICLDCGASLGAADPLSKEFLIASANKADDLSVPGCSVQLADGSYSAPIDVNVYVAQGPIMTPLRGRPLPMVVFKDERISIFLDKAHQVFNLYRIRPEQMIAAEIALYIYTLNGRLNSPQYFGHHSLSVIAWSILNERWANTLEDDPEKLRNDVQTFFTSLRDRLPDLLGDAAGDFYDDLEEDHKKVVVDSMLAQGIDIAQLGKMKTTGRYIRFLEPRTLVKIFSRGPEFFFDKRFWDDTYASVIDLPENIIEQAQQRLRSIYLDCLVDVTRFLEYKDPDPLVLQRARASLSFLQQRIV